MLSQSEIDALLSGTIEMDQGDHDSGLNLANMMGMPAGKSHQGNNDGKVQAYNFWSPDRFSKEQMRAVELIHEDLAERFTTSLPTFLRTNVRPRLVHTEQGRFHEFLKDVPPNSLYYILSLAPLPGQIVMTMSLNVSYIILEQRLGGRNDGRYIERQLTDIDQALLRGLVEHMQGDIKAAWSKVVSIEPVLEDITTNQHWVQMVLGNDRAMLMTFEISIQSVTGTISVFIPFSLLKPIANELDPHIWITGRKEQQTDNTARQTMLQNLYNVVLPVRILLGRTELALKEVVQISLGDVIPLDTSVEQNLVMQVSDQQRFQVKVGKVGNKIGCQVINVIQNDEFLLFGME